jgi:elongation of very long chain fatty acids protein 6
MDWSSNGRWFVIMNYFVHSLMYSYYALQAAGVKVPRFFAMPLTVMQIMQMFGGMYVIAVSGIEDLSGNNSTCPNSRRTLISGFVMYASYMVLFVNFFVQSYIVNKKKRQAQRTEAANGVAKSQMTTTTTAAVTSNGTAKYATATVAEGTGKGSKEL